MNRSYWIGYYSEHERNYLLLREQGPGNVRIRFLAARDPWKEWEALRFGPGEGYVKYPQMFQELRKVTEPEAVAIILAAKRVDP